MSIFSVDDDLDVAWSKTLEQCQEIAKWDLKASGRSNTTVEQVIAQIQPASKDPELRDKAKVIFSQALTCLQRFGSVVAQATSAVFGPSQQVMNGISFLITVTQSYDKVFSGFLTIMERVAAFLQRMQVYLDSQASTLLDKRLRPDVYEVLHHFLNVLAHSHKLASSKSARLKLMAGLLFFGGDGGVQDSLGKLEFKISNVSRTEITLILQGVSEEAINVRIVETKVDRLQETASKTEATTERTEAGVTQLLAEQDRRSVQEQHDQNVARIRKTLNPDEKSPWRESHTSLQNQIVAGSGAWLLQDHQAFQRWSDSSATTTNVLSLSGDEGYGKSCLSSAVVQWLLEKYPKGRTDHGVAVAYYFFQRDAKEKASINKAMRDILWQLTQYNTGFANTAVSACSGSEDASRTLDLWKRFVTDSSKKLAITCFVIVDGIDEPEADSEKPFAAIIRSLLTADSNGRQLQTRMFVSGRSAGLETLRNDVGMTIPQISLGSRRSSDEPPRNQADILSYINRYLDNMKMFKGSLGPELSKLRDRIPSELAAGVEGDFVSLGFKLDEISKCVRVRNIEDILDRSSESRDDAIKRSISSLDTTLSSDEMEELNEMLNFMLGAMDIETVGWVDTECLEGLLLLKTKTPAVVPLSERIKSRYHSLLAVDDNDFVTLVSDNIREYLLASAREIQQNQQSESEVQISEIAIVKRVINTFCGDDLYKRFRFERFFETLGGEKAPQIHVNEAEIHTKIVRSCLLVLCDKYADEDLESLRFYARLFFVYHLRKVDRNIVGDVIAEEIGAKICRLCTEPAFIDSWWRDDDLEEVRIDWIDQDDQDDQDEDKGNIDVIEDWLRNAAMNVVEPSTSNWIMAAVSKEKTDEHVLARVLRRLAERWFGGPVNTATFKCVHNLYCKIREREYDAEANPPLAEIEEVISWAKEELREITGNAHWNYRAAVTYEICAQFEESIACAKQVLLEEPGHWLAQLCMAHALVGDEQISAALLCFKQLSELSGELLASNEEFRVRYWSYILPGMASCYVNLNDPDSAAVIYRKVMDSRFSEFKKVLGDEALDDGQDDYWRNFDAVTHNAYQALSATTKLIAIWRKQEKFSELWDLLRELDRGDTGYKGTRLAAVIQLNSDDGDFENLLHTLANDADTFDFLDTAYGTAIEMTDGEEELSRLLALKHSRGVLAWLRGNSIAAVDRALHIWTEVISPVPENVENSSSVQQTRASAARKLSRVLLERAREVGPGTKEADPYITRLESTMENVFTSSTYEVNSSVLTLGRYYHLAGDGPRAKAVLAGRMKEIFKDWNENPTGYRKSLHLAQTLTVLNDDQNALTAWQLLGPILPEPKSESATNGEIHLVTDGYADIEQTAGVQVHPVADGQEPSFNEDQADAGATVDAHSGANTTKDNVDVSPSHIDDVAEILQQESASDNTPVDDQSTQAMATVAPRLRGQLKNSYCDGCGISWTYVDNIYCCRDCLDVQLEPNCYQKLRSGELDPRICGQNHKFLWIPHFNEKQWRRLATRDMVIVGETEVSREEWLNSVREKWGLNHETFRKEQQLSTSVRAIERFWRIVRSKRQKTGQATTP